MQACYTKSVSGGRRRGRVGMHIGNAITAIALTNFLTEDKDGKGHPTRPRRRSSGNRSNTRQRGSNSFAEHPERW